MNSGETDMIRRRYAVSGQVQGVGFRPFVYRIASENGVTGTVLNGSQGVLAEVQGSRAQVDGFGRDLAEKVPPLARIVSLASEDLTPVTGEDSFEIIASEGGEGHDVLISPDTATCPDCLADMRDPENPRYRYPFTNCTNCGPRYTITRSIPYDRPFTSMSCFPLCERCDSEYTDPLDRRFHAQPNACPDCGPQVWLADAEGGEIARGDEAMRLLAEKLKGGKVAAVKGLGGYHLACDATNAEAVDRLRERKNRPDKPLAVMVPDMDCVRRLAEVMPEDEAWLTGIARPIVLMAKHPEHPLPETVAPDTNFIGLMLPYTPLHHVLFEHLSEGGGGLSALIMTSGNMSSEPISLGNREALSRLSGIADVFLFHDRDILIRCDDSVLRMNPYSGKPIILRRARGFTPSPVTLDGDGPCVLGTGPELKCALTLTKGGMAFPSQHIGNMENLETYGFYREILAHMQDILQVRPELVVRDLHPDYMTSTLADEVGAQLHAPVLALQHHYAHIHAVMAENALQGSVLGLALDGTGYGEDGTIWGGECLFVNGETLEHERLARFAHLRLPGGEAAVREPWRIARGALWELGYREPEFWWPWLAEHEAADKFLSQVLEKDINSPRTSSCGRLFDAASAMIGLCSSISYEGQAAILLEKAQDMEERSAYPCPLLTEDQPAVLDTLTLLDAVREDAANGVAPGVIARRFHLGLINGLAELAATVAENLGVNRIALSGGVMQNLTIAVELPMALEMIGLEVFMHTQVPPNDGCISLGQAVWGRRKLLLDE
jgi:hydrogenase maturation protein HypF